jgi:hypothetical protein
MCVCVCVCVCGCGCGCGCVCVCVCVCVVGDGMLRVKVGGMAWCLWLGVYVRVVEFVC